jgi:hypothetical protein
MDFVTYIVYLKKDELTKNHQEETNTADGRMYEIKGNFFTNYNF